MSTPRKPSLDWRREPPDASNEGQTWAMHEPLPCPFNIIGVVAVVDGEVMLVGEVNTHVCRTAHTDTARWARVPLP